MSEVREVFIKSQEIGHPVYSVVNEKIGITMKVEPMPDYQDDTIVRRKDIAEITFVNNENPDGKSKGWYIWPYVIMPEDITPMDIKDPDYVEEVLGKYGKKFQEINSLNETKDSLGQYRELIGKVFPDIEEKRKKEGREG